MRNTIAILVIVFSGTPILAGDFSDGKALAELNCSRCHALGNTGDSPFKEAPPFRTIHDNFADGELEDAFNEGMMVAASSTRSAARKGSVVTLRRSLSSALIGKGFAGAAV